MSEIPTFGEVVQVLVIFGSKGGSGAFCLKICDILTQQDEVSVTLRSRLVICKAHNERNLS